MSAMACTTFYQGQVNAPIGGLTSIMTVDCPKIIYDQRFETVVNVGEEVEVAFLRPVETPSWRPASRPFLSC